MDREAIRSKKKVVQGLTMVEVHCRQFERLLEYALEQERQLGGEDPKLVAIYWARQGGVSPRAISSVLKDMTPSQVSHALFGLKSRVKKNAELAERLRLP